MAILLALGSHGAVAAYPKTDLEEHDFVAQVLRVQPTAIEMLNEFGVTQTIGAGFHVTDPYGLSYFVEVGQFTPLPAVGENVRVRGVTSGFDLRGDAINVTGIIQQIVYPEIIPIWEPAAGDVAPSTGSGQTQLFPTPEAGGRAKPPAVRGGGWRLYLPWALIWIGIGGLMVFGPGKREGGP